MQTAAQLWSPGSDADAGATAQQIAVQRDALTKSLARLNAIKLNCCSCQQFDMGACKTHGQIPKEFQTVEGECPDWRYDGIPF